MNGTDMLCGYALHPLTEADIPDILALERGNPLFFQHDGEVPSEETIRRDSVALPPGKTAADKHYLGLFRAGKLCAVLDLISGYPQADTAWIGFFMLDAVLQQKGEGSRIIGALCDALQEGGFRAVCLAWHRDNPQASHFWQKNGFVPVDAVQRGERVLIKAERQLNTKQEP